MKKIKLLFMTVLLPFLSIAQGGIEIVPFGGYMFGGRVDFYEGEYNISNGADYGLSLIVPVKHYVDLEVNYTRMQTTGTFRPILDPEFGKTESDLSINYFQIGSLKYMDLNNPKFKPFGSVSVGATWFDFADYDDNVLFSVVLGAGMKFMFSDRVGIMLRGRMMMPMFFGGIGFHFGSGGSGLTMNNYAAIIQGDFNGGLVIKLGN
jgi:hypothetical protein